MKTTLLAALLLMVVQTTPADSDNWTILGIRPGMTRSEVEGVCGCGQQIEPDPNEVLMSKNRWCYQSKQLTVCYTAEKTVRYVVGRSLEYKGKPVVNVTDDIQSAQDRLGPPTSVLRRVVATNYFYEALDLTIAVEQNKTPIIRDFRLGQLEKN